MDEAIKYERTLTAEEVALLHHFVVDAKEWIDTAINEKIANCRKRIIRSHIEDALENNLAIPSTASDVVAAVLSQPEYKNRKQRDDDERKKSNGDGKSTKASI